jgi:glycerophosphoryl diester phosphodiesterase|tara:strand:+ start:1532 stop:2170 length:639 start_codon:yes stop_codon:yes gene_type:complete
LKKIFGHRGLPNVYPENTFLSLNKALEICDFVETDVRITRDEQLILFHDPVINNQKIEELSLREVSENTNTDISEINLTSRDQILGNVNFELKVNNKQETLNIIFVQKIIQLTNPDDIVSSFDWGTILSNREKFNSRYGILIDEENQLFEGKAISNLDDNLMFMIQKDIFHSRKFDLPKDKCVVWTVNDKDEIDNILNTGVYGVVTDIGDKL